MAQVMPYILPLLLGRTFNLDKMQVGIDIFPKSVILNPTIIHNPITRNRYKIVDNMVEARDLLDVEGSFSLNVKSGVFKAGASGEYLTDTYNRENTVELAVTSAYEMVTEQIPVDAKPFPMWQQLGDALGTHYVRSISYGGELIASVRLLCNNTRDRQKIKAAFEVGGRFEIFDLGVEAEGEYDKEIAKSVESTQIKISSSVPLSKVPNDMDTLKEVLDVFPEDLKNFNDGKGVPLKMELWPLELLDPSRPARIKNRALEAEIDTFEEKFDDLRNSKFAISDWMKVTSEPLTENQEQKVGEFYQELEEKIYLFYDVIGNLDMTKGVEQLRKANDAYGNNLPGTFYKKYLKLRQEIAKDQGSEWVKTKGKGATYIHWGRSNCSHLAETMYSGIGMGPNTQGGSNMLCLPDEPKPDSKIQSKKYSTVLYGISYNLPNGVKSRLKCSSCLLGSRGSTEIFVGRTECPEGWEYLYHGQLMSGLFNSAPTKSICLDKKSEIDNYSSKNPLVPNWAVIPKGNIGEKHTLFVCVVCAK